MLHRLIPLLIIITFLGYVAINFQSIRREIAYKFHISGDPTTSCCDIADVLKSDGKFDENATTAIFDNEVIDYPKTSLASLFDKNLADASEDNNTKILGTTTASGEEKWVEVSLVDQKLTAWEGNKIVMQFLISSGKWAPTPVGDFTIWYKTRSQSMIGGSKALGTYYNLSNVPFNMFFNGGFAIHGAYWHNNFGHPMSHGCVNAPIPNAAQLFEWTGPYVGPNENAVRATASNPGTRVYIH